MNKGGLIIRLIDVAMIILFGFIAISDITVKAQIKLPSEQTDQSQTNQKEPRLIFVKIDLERGYVLAEGYTEILSTTDIVQLENNLIQLLDQSRAEGREMVVLIEPDENSMIQKTVDVMDVCERNQISKNINYESMQF